jgi:hypothetical protein
MTTDRALALLALAIAGCASSLPAWTSAQVGCPADEVVITKEEVVWSSRTWTARCRGKTYSCSEHNEGQSSARVSCKGNAEDAPESPSAARRPCHFDTECSGDRRCRDDYCVEPAAAVPDPVQSP